MLHSIATLLLLLASLFMAYIAMYCWRNRNALGMRNYTVATATLGLWIFMYYLEWTATNGLFKSVFLHFRAALFWVHPLFVAFSIEYVGKGHLLKRRWVQAANLAVPVLGTLLYLSNPWTEWVIAFDPASSDLSQIGSAVAEFQPLYYVLRGLTFSHSFTGILILATMYQKASVGFRRQTNILMYCLAAIVAVELMNWMILPGFDTIPFLLAFTSSFYIYNLNRGGMLGIAPVRREVLIEGMQVGIVVIDASRRIVEVNSETTRLLVKNLNELVSADFDTVLGAALPFSESDFRQPQSRREFSYRSRWLDSDLKQLKDPSGQTTGWLLTLRDSTETRDTLEIIRQNEQRLKVHLQLTPLAYLELNADLEVIDCNESAARAFGWTRQQLMGERLLEILFPPTDRPLARELFQQVMNERVNINCSFVNQRADGRQIVCDWYNTPLLNDADDIVSIACLALDVTESCLAITEMLVKTTELQTILRAIPDLYFRVNVDGTIIDCQSTNDEDLLFPIAEFLGKPLREFLPTDIAVKAMKAIHEACLLNQLQSFEYELNIRDHSQHFEARFSPLNRSECVTLVRNITDLKNAQKELLLKNDVMAAYSHHLKGIQQISTNSFGKYRYKFAPLFQEFLETGKEIFGMNHGLVSRVQNDSFWVFSSSTSLELDIGHRFDLRQTLCRRVLQSGAPLFLRYPHSRQHLGREDVFAYLAAPISVGGKVFGTLSFFSTVPYDRQLQPYQMEILELLADIIGKYIALQREEQSRQAAEKELLNSQKRYQGLVEAQSDLILRFSPKLKITFANRAFFEGFSLDRATGPYSEPFRVQEQLLGQRIEWRRDQLDAPPHRVEFEETVETPRGNRWFSHEIIALVNEQGEATEYQLVLRDLTDRKQAQERIAFQANLLDQVNSAVIALDLQGRIIYWNRSAEQLLGWTAEEMLHLPINSPQLPPCFGQLFGRAVGRIQRDFAYEGEAMLEDRKGRELPVLASLGQALGNAQEPIAIVGILVDITDRKDAENELLRAKVAAEEATAAKSNFLAVMSHEIRTPLNAVIGMTGLLTQTNLTPDQGETLRTIRQSGETLLSLLNNILDFTKIESGKMELDLQPCNLAETVESTLELMQSQARSQGIRLFTILPDDLPTDVPLDAPKLQQVLLNLVANAVKFTSEGYVAVRVRWDKPTDGQRPQLRFTVRDTGIGIPPDKADRLFQAFSQLDSGSTRRYGGTGLGLAICKRLIEMMNGTISIDRVLGPGVQFSFTVPLPAETVRPIPQRPWLGQSVLIVDECETCRDRWQEQASLLGLNARKTDRWELPSDLNQVWLAYESWDENRLHEIRQRGIRCLVYDAPSDQRPAAGCGWLTAPSRWSAFLQAMHEMSRSPSTAETPSSNGGGAIDSTLHERFPLQILVAEDHPINQKLIKLLLQRMGYEPDLVANGREVLEALKGRSYDLIFMDIQMPEMDGLEATQHIMKQEANPLKRPAIVAMTANAFNSERERCLRAGFNEYLTKPIRVELVQKTIEAVGRQRLAAAR